jgi:hypothetical protein
MMPYKDQKKNKECIIKYHQTHRNEINATQREWVNNNREKWNAMQRRLSRNRRSFLRTEILHLLGGKCVRCGFSDVRALQIDHVNLKAKHREKRHGQATTGSEMYLKFILNQVRNGSKDYQCLCANCNWIKRCENGEDGWHHRNV